MENTFVSNLYNTGDFTEGGETTSRLWLGLVYDNGNFSWVNLIIQIGNLRTQKMVLQIMVLMQ